MTILNRPVHLLPGIKQGALALIAAATLGVGSTSAFAGTAELKLLQEELGATPIANANSQQLLNAIIAVLTENPKLNTTKKQGVVVGEALKAAGANATDAGDVIGDAIVAANGSTTSPLGTIFADRNNFTALAGKTAGSGKGLNVLQVPGLAASLFPVTTSNADYIAVAKLSKNKPATGAILAGKARLLGAAQFNQAASLANDALLSTNKLTSSAQDIAKYIAAELDDTAGFAVLVGNGNTQANNKYAVQIAVGSAAGDPTNAGNIAHAILGEQVLTAGGTLANPSAAPSATLTAAAIKGLTKLVKDMAAVADIEEIQKIGNAVGLKIAEGTVKLSKAASTVKTLATAVMNKPGTATGRNSAANKQDEIAEVAAYLVSGLVGTAELDGSTPAKAKSTANKLLAIINAAAKVKPKVTKGVANGPAAGSFAADVAGSVAYIIENSPDVPQEVKAAFEILMTDAKTAAKIDKNNAATIAATITGVYANTTAVINRLETGTLTAAVSDPETDSRPFNGGQS